MECVDTAYCETRFGKYSKNIRSLNNAAKCGSIIGGRRKDLFIFNYFYYSKLFIRIPNELYKMKAIANKTRLTLSAQLW